MIDCVDGCLDFVCDICKRKPSDRERVLIALNTEGTALDGDCYRGYWGDRQLGNRFWQIDGQAGTNAQLERARQFGNLAVSRIDGAKVTSSFENGAVCVDAEIKGEVVEAEVCRRGCP